MNRLGGHARFENLAQLKAILDNDLIMGKVANDQTNETITAYLSGAYGANDTSNAPERKTTRSNRVWGVPKVLRF